MNATEGNEPNRIINLGSGFSYNMREILKNIEDFSNHRIAKSIIRNDSFISHNLYIDNSDVIKILGRTPEKMNDIIARCSWVI